MGLFSKFFGSGGEKCSDILEAKTKIENKKGIEYDDLNEWERINFIYDCFDIMENKSILSKCSEPIINALMETRFGKKNPDVVRYINELSNEKVNDSIVSLVIELIENGSIIYKDCKSWLDNESLYMGRATSDICYAIKILTLASNINLQLENGHNKIFDDDNPLTVQDLMDSNGKIYNNARIKDILDDKQTKEVFIPDNNGQ